MAYFLGTGWEKLGTSSREIERNEKQFVCEDLLI
jgi:hypothetical protein